MVVCRRRASHPSHGEGRKRTDKGGADCWLFRLRDDKAREEWSQPRFDLINGNGERADTDTLSLVYNLLLDNLPLEEKHVEQLQARGYGPVGKVGRLARQLGYRTLGRERARAAYALVKAGLEEKLPTVPGFFVQKKNGRRYWTVAGGSGLLIPVRDEKRRIVGLVVRLDDAPKGTGKYRWISSKRYGGPGPVWAPHQPLFEGDITEARLTEGPLKADLATHLSGMLTVGLPSVAGWRRAAKTFRTLGVKVVRLAFDADASTNPHVAEALRGAAHDLRSQGFTVRLERWQQAHGKGIDDVLSGSKQPEVLDGEAVLEAVEALVASAGEAANAPDQQQTAAQPQATTAAVQEALDDPHRLARLFLRLEVRHPDRARVVFFREQFWEWTGGTWVAVPDTEMRGRLAHFCKAQLDRDSALVAAEWDGKGEPPKVPKVTLALVSNVMQALSGDVLLPQDTPMPCWLGDGPRHCNYIALRNGLLDVDALLAGGEEPLLRHTPLWFSSVTLPYDYDPLADCPRWRAFLACNLAGDVEKARLLQQFAGYIMLPDTSLQRFMMLIGEGANGKSVACAAFSAMLGEANVSRVPLELFADKFRLANTIGKLANIIAEVGELDKVAEGQIKAFVSGDPIECERKFKAPFTAKPTARLILATNNPPQFSDKSDGLWRRMLLLHFTVQIPEAERIAGMDTVAYWHECGELPGMLNWGLAGLQELRAQGRFVVPDACQDAVNRLRGDANPARRFLEENYAEGDGDVPTSHAYTGYVAWCRKHGHHALADVGFGREVFRKFPTVKRAKRMIDGRRTWAYCGLVRISED
jgi:P4 family phage/plasmid primase-like protien